MKPKGRNTARLRKGLGSSYIISSNVIAELLFNKGRLPKQTFRI